MPRRCNDNLPVDDPPKKKTCTSSPMSSFSLKSGEFLKDIAGKKWKLGKTVGVGGFGEIFLATDDLKRDVKTDSSYVAKIENHKNGPLFVEVICYLRIAKLKMIEEFKREHKLKYLGMPHYVASGSHTIGDEKYRFLILPKFDKDLERILEDKKMLNLKSVLVISSQILDVLWYIHSKGYIHSDVKASNILLRNHNSPKRNVLKSPVRSVRLTGCNPVRACRMKRRTRVTRNLRPQSAVNYIDDIPDFDNLIAPKISIDIEHKNREATSSCDSQNQRDQVYLLDYGLASKFLSANGEHKPFCVDQRRAHAGTILFCSRDAHKGVSSRRSDLESLGYNIIYWLTGSLPWSKDCDDPELVEKKKQKAMAEPEIFLKICFNDDYPKFLLEYFSSLQNLKFQEEPDYNYYKKLFKRTLKEHGYKDDSCFDFDNLEGWGSKQKKVNRKSENMKVPKFVYKMSRPPLQSNIHIKPLLRKKMKSKKLKQQMNWSKILIDPEVILKQAREKKNENVESFDLTRLDIQKLNPTPTMMEIYNKYLGNLGSFCSLETVEGYTPAMMSVLQKVEARKMQENVAVTTNKNGSNSKRVCRRRKLESPNKTTANTKTNGTRSNMVVKKENVQSRKLKGAAYLRSYALRG